MTLSTPRSRFVAAALLLALLRVWLTSHVPSRLDDLRVDDFLYTRLADHVAAGEWLGPYDHTTLAKRPGYAFFLAGVHHLGIPRRIAEDAMLVLAGLVLLAALRAAGVGRPFALAVFAGAIFCPMTFELTTKRPVREGLYVAETLLVIGLAIRLAAPGRLLSRAGLSVVLGAVLGLYELTREEGIWIVPSLLVIAGSLIAGERRRGRSRVGALAVAALLVVPAVAVDRAILAAVRHQNEERYGVAVLCDQEEPTFVAAMTALRRFDPEPWERYEPLRTAARHRLYAASPAFASLRAGLESPSFTLPSMLTASGERMFSYTSWLIRDTVASVGHAGSATETAAFYRQLEREVTAAAPDRQTAGGLQLTGFPALKPSEFDDVVAKAHEALVLLATQEIHLTTGYPAVENGSALPEQRALYERVLNEPATLASGPSTRWRFAGMTALRNAFHAALPWLAVLGVVGLLVQLVRIRHLVPSALLGVQVALTGAVGGRALLVGVIDTYWWPTESVYLLPAAPLLVAVSLLGVRGGALALGGLSPLTFGSAVWRRAGAVSATVLAIATVGALAFAWREALTMATEWPAREDVRALDTGPWQVVTSSRGVGLRARRGGGVRLEPRNPPYGVISFQIVAPSDALCDVELRLRTPGGCPASRIGIQLHSRDDAVSDLLTWVDLPVEPDLRTLQVAVGKSGIDVISIIFSGDSRGVVLEALRPIPLGGSGSPARLVVRREAVGGRLVAEVHDAPIGSQWVVAVATRLAANPTPFPGGIGETRLDLPTLLRRPEDPSLPLTLHLVAGDEGIARGVLDLPGTPEASALLYAQAVSDRGATPIERVP